MDSGSLSHGFKDYPKEISPRCETGMSLAGQTGPRRVCREKDMWVEAPFTPRVDAMSNVSGHFLGSLSAHGHSGISSGS